MIDLNKNLKFLKISRMVPLNYFCQKVSYFQKNQKLLKLNLNFLKYENNIDIFVYTFVTLTAKSEFQSNPQISHASLVLEYCMIPFWNLDKKRKFLVVVQ